MQQFIYLDNNATTPMDPRVLEAMLPYFTQQYGNASSPHQLGMIAANAVKKARKQVADLIGANPKEIVFTSGATEAINLALKGLVQGNSGSHIITTKTEHRAVLDCCRYLESIGCEVTYLDVKSNGLIDLEQLESALRPETLLVCVMLVNNETGVIQPIREIANMVHENSSFLMTDATQAVGKIAVNVGDLDVDFMAFSAHKVYGPKGVGALYIKQQGKSGIDLYPLIHGGGHEKGFRSGTLNVPGIVAFGKTCELVGDEIEVDKIRLGHLRDSLEKELLSIEGASVNGDKAHRIYNTTNICFKGVDSDALIAGLSSSKGISIAVSNGSACTSSLIESSHVLRAMGLSDEDAFSSIRFSLGKFNTQEEMDIASAQIKNLVTQLKQIHQSSA